MGGVCAGHPLCVCCVYTMALAGIPTPPHMYTPAECVCWDPPSFPASCPQAVEQLGQGGGELSDEDRTALARMVADKTINQEQLMRVRGELEGGGGHVGVCGGGSRE